VKHDWWQREAELLLQSPGLLPLNGKGFPSVMNLHIGFGIEALALFFAQVTISVHEMTKKSKSRLKPILTRANWFYRIT
jgi:hypothetical protein